MAVCTYLVAFHLFHWRARLPLAPPLHREGCPWVACSHCCAHCCSRRTLDCCRYQLSKARIMICAFSRLIWRSGYHPSHTPLPLPFTHKVIISLLVIVSPLSPLIIPLQSLSQTTSIFLCPSPVRQAHCPREGGASKRHVPQPGGRVHPRPRSQALHIQRPVC